MISCKDLWYMRGRVKSCPYCAHVEVDSPLMSSPAISALAATSPTVSIARAQLLKVVVTCKARRPRLEVYRAESGVEFLERGSNVLGRGPRVPIPPTWILGSAGRSPVGFGAEPRRKLVLNAGMGLEWSLMATILTKTSQITLKSSCDSQSLPHSKVAVTCHDRHIQSYAYDYGVIK